MMQEPRQQSHQSWPNPKFKIWEKRFDGLKFLHDHLNSKMDIAKAKSINPQQLTANLEAYLIWSVVMVCALFKASDDSDKAEHRLSLEMIKFKEALKVHTKKFDEVNWELAQLSEERESFVVLLLIFLRRSRNSKI